MKIGYYIPSQDLLAPFGDDELSKKAFHLFSDLGLDHSKCERYDGATIFQLPSGRFICRIILQNFFNPNFDIKMHDYPMEDM